MIRVEIDSVDAQAAFARLRQQLTTMRPLMQDLGEHLVEATKRRFETSTAPDGSRWALNAETTYLRYLGRFQGGEGVDGRLNAKGAARAAAKKPLIGETRALSTSINYLAGDQFVEIGSPMVYAAVQQFGAKARSFTGGKSPWGDIPARPFLGLSGEDEAEIGRTVSRYLEGALDGP